MAKSSRSFSLDSELLYKFDVLMKRKEGIEGKEQNPNEFIEKLLRRAINREIKTIGGI